MDPVTTGQIYWGAVPFVVIQVIMVLLVIAFPQMVMHYKGTASTVDPNTIKIEMPQTRRLPPLDFGATEAVAASRPATTEKPRSYRSGALRSVGCDSRRSAACACATMKLS